MLTAIFDMDGLLLDTDPLLWQASMQEICDLHHIPANKDLFKYTKGLRIYEVTAFWKQRFGWDASHSSILIADEIIDNIIARTIAQGSVMPGVIDTLEVLQARGYRMAVATSSPQRMAETLINKFELGSYFERIETADQCIAGKPHPEVYLNCAAHLGVDPWQCVAFEDSLNGIVAAKAARMYAIAVPENTSLTNPKFGIADLVLPSLEAFNIQQLSSLD